MSAGAKTLLGTLVVTVVVLVGLTVHGLREEVTPASASRTASVSAVVVGTSEAAPWQAAASPAAILPGTVPVSQIDPPRPDPAMPMPAGPVPPPNPALHRPPLDNPGGVDGDRPARAVPGLD